MPNASPAVVLGASVGDASVDDVDEAVADAAPGAADTIFGVRTDAVVLGGAGRFSSRVTGFGSAGVQFETHAGSTGTV